MTNIKSHYYLVGYAQDGMEQKKVFMKPTAENIANFIMQNKEASIIITDELDLPVITAYQGFVHKYNNNHKKNITRIRSRNKEHFLYCIDYVFFAILCNE